MKAWVGYAGLALVLAVVGMGVAAVATTPEAARGVRFAAVLAWAVQVGAFAFLVWVREQPALFLAAWVAGIGLRFVVVGLVAFWVTRTQVYPPAPTLVGLVGFVFIMVLLEPLFLKKGLPSA
jgi:hypothetical protein